MYSSMHIAHIEHVDCLKSSTYVLYMGYVFNKALCILNT